MSKFIEANEKIAEVVVDGYKKIEGGVISAFIIVMSVYMIVQSTKKIKLLNISGEL